MNLDMTATRPLRCGHWLPMLLTTTALTLGGTAAQAEEQHPQTPAVPPDTPAPSRVSGHGFDLVVREEDAGTRVQLVCDGHVLASSPTEGLW